MSKGGQWDVMKTEVLENDIQRYSSVKRKGKIDLSIWNVVA